MTVKKDPRRQLLGAQAHAKGKWFENRLDRSFTYYRENAIAAVEKTPEPMKPIRSMGKGQFVAIYEKKAQPDYKGVMRGGQEVVMEAKYTDTDRIQQDRVGEVQSVYLNLHETLGAMCFIICGFSSGKVYRVPWRVWQTMKSRFGHKYVTETDIKRYEVQHTANGTLLILD